VKIVIVEDEIPAAKRLQTMVKKVEPGAEFLAVIDSVGAAAAWFGKHPAPDLAFMDVQLADGLSFEIFDAVRVPCPVVFTTAFDEYALRAFRVNSIDYLVKPVDAADLARALEKYRLFRPAPPVLDLQAVVRALRPGEHAYRARFLIPVADRFVSVPVEDVAFFHAAHEVTSIVTRAGQRHTISATLDDLVQELDPAKFFRANRQYVVRYESIASVHAYFAGKLKVRLLRSDDEVIVSKGKAGSFKEWLGR
jgi:DNA-binding LytR/AlgR family response regulator